MSREIPHIHQLYSLIKKAGISEQDTLKILNASIMLDELYQAARYPSRGKEVSKKQAQEALERTQEIEKILLQYLE